MKILTKSEANPKLHKSTTQEWMATGIHLAPADMSGYNVCSHASPVCKRFCLGRGGNGRYKRIRDARIAKTKLFYEDNAMFMRMLRSELHSFVAKCISLGTRPACRLNLTSDIVWEIKHPELFDEFRCVQFYDYTKIVARVSPNWKLPSNYHLTFSHSEVNYKSCRKIMATTPTNIAVVFNEDNVPNEWGYGFVKRPVINGDDSDLRFLDPPHSVVALTPKGFLKKKRRKGLTSFSVSV